jgi:tungstate transport system ATP-binding protein
MNPAPLIELQDCAVRFGPTQALAPLSLQLHRGERIALVGSNGSGKTTLLRLLHGQLAGHISQGRRHAAAGQGGREVAQAMVFQRPFLLRLSVGHNLTVALWLAGVPHGEHAERSRLALQRVGLAALAGRAARSLSVGQQQRLALARAWAVRPQLLFLDEPTASLDPAAKREVEALVAEFADEGMTLVMSTHNLGQAKRLARRVVCLDGGHVVADLPTARFFAGPLPEAAARFVRGELP